MHQSGRKRGGGGNAKVDWDSVGKMLEINKTCILDVGKKGGGIVGGVNSSWPNNGPVPMEVQRDLNTSINKLIKEDKQRCQDWTGRVRAFLCREADEISRVSEIL